MSRWFGLASVCRWASHLLTVKLPALTNLDDGNLELTQVSLARNRTLVIIVMTNN